MNLALLRKSISDAWLSLAGSVLLLSTNQMVVSPLPKTNGPYVLAGSRTR